MPKTSDPDGPRNLARRPLLRDLALLVCGLVVMSVPEQGLASRMLGLNVVVGALIAVGGLWDAFNVLFGNREWVEEARRLGNLLLLRALWMAGVAAVVTRMILS